MIYWVVPLKTFSSLMITITTGAWPCRSSTQPSVSPCFGLPWVFGAWECLWGHCCLPRHGQGRWSLFCLYCHENSLEGLFPKVSSVLHSVSMKQEVGTGVSCLFFSSVFCWASCWWQGRDGGLAKVCSPESVVWLTLKKQDGNLSKGPVVIWARLLWGRCLLNIFSGNYVFYILFSC